MKILILALAVLCASCAKMDGPCSENGGIVWIDVDHDTGYVSKVICEDGSSV